LRQLFPKTTNPFRIGWIVSRSHFLEAIQSLHDLVVCLHTTAEIFSQNGLEADSIKVIAGVENLVLNQLFQHVPDAFCIIRHSLVSTIGEKVGSRAIHLKKTVLERGGTQIGYEDFHVVLKLGSGSKIIRSSCRVLRDRREDEG